LGKLVLRVTVSRDDHDPWVGGPPRRAGDPRYADALAHAHRARLQLLFFEEIAPLMVILGVFARFGASAMVFWMVMAFALAHIDTGHIFELDANAVGWRVEGPFFFLMCSLSVALIGAGRYGLNIGGK
jgi:uncharacterized membrane protein YphA (DoxX/SURF4 family)